LAYVLLEALGNGPLKVKIRLSKTCIAVMSHLSEWSGVSSIDILLSYVNILVRDGMEFFCTNEVIHPCNAWQRKQTWRSRKRLCWTFSQWARVSVRANVFWCRVMHSSEDIGRLLQSPPHSFAICDFWRGARPTRMTHPSGHAKE